jgi:hypothetical protein
MTQTGLTNRIIAATGMQDCNPDHTPADPVALGTHTHGDPFNESWDYASIVGMLMYLASNTRPDISFAVHQCARFTHVPRAAHAKALKRIVRYLKGTMDQGIIYTPQSNFSLDCYVDADFAGLWKSENTQDAICVKSRTGYVLTLAGCPLMWVSKLQTEIALSTMEAEYVALSQSMRDLLPMRNLLSEIAEVLLISGLTTPITHSTVFEDNANALQLAIVPRMTPRSKHIAIKYHFFRSHVKQGSIQVVKIDTRIQKADILTKGLSKITFQLIRGLLLGW